MTTGSHKDLVRLNLRALTCSWRDGRNSFETPITDKTLGALEQRATRMSEKVLWEELEPLASGWDCVWDDKDKLEWAKQAWWIITEAGLPDFFSPLERARVVIRFMALAGIFSDFYEIAFSDGHKPEYLYIAKELGVTDFQLGQLAGRG